MREVKKLKTLFIDTEKGVCELNGESIASGCSKLTLEFENGEWSLVLTRYSIYSTSIKEVTE